MKNYIIVLINILIFSSCKGQVTDKKILDQTLFFLSKKNVMKQINIFNEIKNYREHVNTNLKNVKIISCKEINNTGEVDFYILKFDHISKNNVIVEIVNYNTLESFKLHFNQGNPPKKESLHSDATGRPYMIYSKQLRKKEPYSNNDAFKYIDSYPSDSITCK